MMAVWQVLLVVVAAAAYYSNADYSASPMCALTPSARDYTGLISHTKHGDKCKWWNTTYWNGLYGRFPDDIEKNEVSDLKNYCRNPMGQSGIEAQPWCYYKEDGSWDWCDVPICLDDCKTTTKGLEYTGKASYSEEGRTCMSWSDARVLDKGGFTAADFPDHSVADAKNYCRNPDEHKDGPWCYINILGDTKHYEFCNVTMCSDLHPGCKTTTKGREYTGQINFTAEYWMCQRWDKQFPHGHTRNNIADFPDDTLDDAANYCRNPDDEPAGPWCYTTNPDVRWKYCDVPWC